jgi:hypothetical protein
VPQACGTQEQRVEVEPQVAVVAGLKAEVPLASGDKSEEFFLEDFAVHQIPVRVEQTCASNRSIGFSVIVSWPE